MSQKQLYSASEAFNSALEKVKEGTYGLDLLVALTKQIFKKIDITLTTKQCTDLIKFSLENEPSTFKMYKAICTII